MSFKKIRSIIREVLEKDERARGDDKWLIYLVWSRFTKVYIPFDSFRLIPSAETITRCRREFNSKGFFLPKDQKIIERRAKKERAFRDYYGKQLSKDADY